MDEKDYMKSFREIRKQRGNVFSEEEDIKISELTEHNFLMLMRRKRQRERKKIYGKHKWHVRGI